MEGIVKAFLDQGPPWIGDSAFGDKVDVKKAGARWDAVSKKWKAPDEPTLLALINDGKWRPAGHDSTFGGEVVRYIRRREKAAELAEQQKREAARKSKKPTQPTLLALINDGKWRPAGHDSTSGGEVVRYIRRREKAAELAEQQKREAAGKSKKPTQAQKNCTARSDLMIPPDEPHLLAEALEHGVDQALVTSTGAFAHLGPRSGISDASRLFRGLRFGLVTWESLKNGDAARVGQDRSSEQKSSSTGAGGKGGKGVKRGAGSMGGTSGILKWSTSDGGSVAKTEDLPNPVKQRKRVRDVVTYRYTATCDKCNTTLDSREQFGLECGCFQGVSQWHACGRCFMPKREAGHCGPCAQRLEEIKQEEEALNSNS